MNRESDGKSSGIPRVVEGTELRRQALLRGGYCCGLACRPGGCRLQGYIRRWQRAYISGKMLVGAIGDRQLHEVQPKRKRRGPATLFIPQRLPVVVANPNPAGDGGRETD